MNQEFFIHKRQSYFAACQVNNGPDKTNGTGEWPKNNEILDGKNDKRGKPKRGNTF